MKDKDGVYTITDCTSAHNQVLLRKNYVGSDNEENFNQDILFIGVSFLNLPFTLKGIEMEEISPKLMKDGCIKNAVDKNSKVISIKSSDEEYFVVANRVLMQKNSLNNSESSIPSKREKELDFYDIKSIVEEVKTKSHEERMQMIQTSDWIRIF